MGSTMSCCSSEKVDEGVVGAPGNTTWRMFTYKELHNATNGFSDDNKLGEGGFGSVYWGKTSDGLEIAVKKLKAMTVKAEMEFAVEVEVLGRVKHKNLLGLRGYCVGTDQRLIVYDYKPNLSVLSHLHGQFAGDIQLDWKKRMKIAIGSAEAYCKLLFPDFSRKDIKASNVLLDSNFEPLVADFGFAKLIGRKPIEKLPGGVKRTITEWAEPLIANGRFKDLVDPKLRVHFDENQLKQVIYVAALCVQSEPEKRPNMMRVVGMLKGYDTRGNLMKTRMDSVKYKEELLELDQTSDDDLQESCGVFGVMVGTKMQDPYSRHGNKKITKHV
ncbi:LRR receptor-like serine/threonine-protein kinase [Hibiscus syriacus]|uniref:non-specific serine/threonine protein kinase n=1 Tax=Hibiscus syriacus TaxID=106335 RepID=A0A6A2ZG48_HIBSY|nr:LRR receptor-like serine/threonine-protein kinase [Hibiscus syriacus]